MKRPKYSLESFIKLFRKIVKKEKLRFYLDSGGEIRATSVPKSVKNPADNLCLCPLTVVFGDWHDSTVVWTGNLSQKNADSIIYAADISNPNKANFNAKLRKRLLKIAGLAALLLMFAGNAAAWPACSGRWVSVPKGTTGGTLYSTGDLLFQCQTDPTPPASGSSNQQQNQNQTQTATGGSSTATGGSSVSNSKSSSQLTNSGNSSNVNTNANTLSQSSTTSSTASASNNGNGSNNSSYNNETNIKEAQIPVSTAVGAAPPPTATCFKGYGGGVQTLPVGISFGGGKIDENCAILETARSFDGAGEYLAGCKVKVSNKYAKAAGVSLEDCLVRSKPVVPVPGSSVPEKVTPPTVIVVPAPAPTPTPVPVATNTGKVVAGECRLYNLKLTNACYRVLDDFVIRLNNAPNGKLSIRGPIESTQAVKYLKSRVASDRVEYTFSDDQNNVVEISLWSVE